MIIKNKTFTNVVQLINFMAGGVEVQDTDYPSKTIFIKDGCIYESWPWGSESKLELLDLRIIEAGRYVSKPFKKWWEDNSITGGTEIIETSDVKTFSFKKPVPCVNISNNNVIFIANVEEKCLSNNEGIEAGFNFTDFDGYIGTEYQYCRPIKFLD